MIGIKACGLKKDLGDMSMMFGANVGIKIV